MMKKAIYIITALIFVPNISFAAIAYDTNAGAINSAASTGVNANITTAGTNEAIVIGAYDFTTTLTGVTVAGNSATLIRSLDLAGNGRMYMYQYLGASGTQNIAVARSLNSSDEIAFLALAYTNVAQTGQPDSQTSKSVSATSITTSNTSVADNSWQVQWTLSTGAAISAGSGTTDRTGSLISAGQKMGDNNGPIHPAGSNSMTWTQGSSPLIGTISITLSPFVASPASPIAESAKGFIW